MVGLGPLRVPARAAAVGGDQGVPVLMYHRVDRQLSARDSITVHLTVMQSAFEAQLQALRAAGYRSMSLEMLRAALDRRAVPARRVVLTFDDGYEDHFATVLPLLRKYGFAGTFFIVTSSAGTRDHLTMAQIRQMAEAGMEIGSHGVHHVDFSQLPWPRRVPSWSKAGQRSRRGPDVALCSSPIRPGGTALRWKVS